MAKTNLVGCVLVLCAIVAFARQSQDANANNGPAQPPQTEAKPVPSAPAAAAATSPMPATEMAHLRVYRQRRYVGSGLAPSIFVDGKQVARVGNGRRVTIKLTVGSHTIASDDKSSAISIDAKAGQDYYVRVDEATGFWKGHGKLTLLMPEQGSAEYKLQKPIESDRRIVPDMIEEDAETTPPEKTK